MDTTNLKVKKLVIELDQTPASVNKTTAPVSKTPAPVTKTTAPVSKTPAPVTKTTAPVSEDKVETKRDQTSLLGIVGAILLGLLGILLLAAFAWFLFNKLAMPTATSTASAPASVPIDNPAPALPNNDVWTAVLTSANSNGNFIGDMGGKGNGSVIPTQAVDLQGKTWKVGRALLTYCETASTCFYMFAKPNDVMPRAFNVNLYTPEFTGDLEKELQYVNTGWNNNANVTWTYWK